MSTENRALPSEISEQVARDRKARGALESLHCWWARRFAERLRSVVAQRNRIEHDSGGYWSGSPTAQLAIDCAAILRDAADLLSGMAADRAVPRVGTAVLEIRDQWGRVSYRVVLDDGTEAEIYLSNAVPLGRPLLYFGSATNPRPVDPLLVLLDDLGHVP
jgi:hypothetical protein